MNYISPCVYCEGVASTDMATGYTDCNKCSRARYIGNKERDAILANHPDLIRVKTKDFEFHTKEWERYYRGMPTFTNFISKVFFE